MINLSVQRQIDEDFDLAVAGPKKGGSLRPPQPGAVTSAINAERKRMEQNARRRAAYRLKREQMKNGQ